VDTSTLAWVEFDIMSPLMGVPKGVYRIGPGDVLDGLAKGIDGLRQMGEAPRDKFPISGRLTLTSRDGSQRDALLAVWRGRLIVVVDDVYYEGVLAMNACCGEATKVSR